MTCRQATDRRRAELARIHIAAQELGMDDETYRDMLFTVARVRSARDLDAGGRQRVLDHLKACGAQARHERRYQGRPHNIDSADRGPMLGKIEAYLSEAGRPWRYAHGMARRMYHVERLDFCDARQLRGIITAMEKDAQRHGRRTA